jgi:stage V sporulation protein B
VFDLNIKNKKDERGRERSFFSGVFLLSMSTVIVKLLGLGFKIPMLSFLGTEGMGYFNSAYEIYAMLCTVATAGLPVALSILVASSRAEGDLCAVERVYRYAHRVFLVFGVSASTLMIVFSEELASLIGNPDAKQCIIAIAPTLLFICIAGAIRGYCQGFEYMTPTAVSQLIEAIGKLVLGIFLASFAIKRGYSLPTVSAFAVLGISIGSLFSLLYLWLVKRLKPLATRDVYSGEESAKTGRLRSGEMLMRLLRIAIPITLGSAVIGLTRIIDMTLIMHRLGDVGIDAARRNEIYGAYTTLALPVFSLIPALIAPVSVALVPQLSAFSQSKDKNGEATVLENSIRLTVILALPAALGLTAFARPILELIFHGQSEAIDISAPLLSALGGSVLFSCLMTTTNAILQAYKRPGLPIISMTVGVAVKLISSYALMGVERIGVMGAPLGSLLCNICVTLINLAFVFARSPEGIDAWRLFFKPLAAAVLSVGGAFALYAYLCKIISDGASPFAIALAVAVLLYLLLSLLMGSITTNDISLLPFGDRLVRRRKATKQEE